MWLDQAPEAGFRDFWFLEARLSTSEAKLLM